MSSQKTFNPNVQRLSLYGSPNIGVIMLTSEKDVVISQDLKEQQQRIKIIENTLHAKITYLEGTGTVLGVFGIMNSYGVVLSPTLAKKTIANIEDQFPEKNILVLDKYYSIGNLLAVNDYAGIASPLLRKEDLVKIKKCLDVPLFQSTIADSPLVGSLSLITNRSAVLTPHATEEDIEFVKNTLNLESIGVGTVNRGQVYLKSGAVANTKGLICGSNTTALEIINLTNILFG